MIAALRERQFPRETADMAESKKQAQALAIKLSRERRAGKKVPAPPKRRYGKKTQQRARRDLEAGRTRAQRGTTKKRTSKGHA
jgi:hypothetical protein